MADDQRRPGDPDVAEFQAVAEALLVDAGRAVHAAWQRRWDATVPALRTRITELEALLEQAEPRRRPGRIARWLDRVVEWVIRGPVDW